MELAKLNNTLKKFYNSGKQLACRLVKFVMHFCRSIKLHISTVLKYTKKNLTMELGEPDNILKRFYNSGKQLACRLVKSVMHFCRSIKLHISLILFFSLVFAYMITKHKLTTDFFDVFVILFIVLFALYLTAIAFHITYKFRKGSDKQRKGDYEKAIKYYDSVIRIHQNNQFIFPVLSLILGINPETGLKAPTDIPTSTLDSGVSLTYPETGLKAPTDIPTSTLDSGVSLIHEDRNLSVQEYSYPYELNEYILRNTNIFTAAYYNRGYSNAASGHYERAIEDFDKAIGIDPKYATAYYSRGNSKALLKKDHNGAIEDYSKAIAIDPSDAYAYTNRGNSRAILKDYEGAIEDFDKAIELNPRHKHGL